jgi:3',5'-cyclic AMP phosphodiesterase CpdA
MSAGVIRIAHVSDPHLSTLRGVRMRELCNKRILGYLSWLWRRRREHRRDVLARLMADLAARHPDRVVISGDLTHVGTPDECRQARVWLDAIAASLPLTLIPGNHDAYIAAPWEDTVGRWQPYLCGDDAGAPLFPSLRRHGPVALIGLSSANPSPPFCATGTLGAPQLAALGPMLARTRRDGLFRLVIVHHPPAPRRHEWRRALTDARALQRVLADEGAELLLHGHSHCWLDTTVPGPQGAIPALGAPSASALTRRTGRRAGYSMLAISASGAAWDVTVERYELDDTGTGIRARDTLRLQRPRTVSVPAPATAGPAA